MLDNLTENHIKKTAKLLAISADFVRKDYYVTQAIKALVSVQNEYFALVFQGGTSLSKAYQVVSRLSEDVDFRIISKPASSQLGKNTRRDRLRDFRYSLIDALLKAGFLVPKENIKVFYEGRFMNIPAIFDGSSALTYLKPHIAVECFVGELLLEPQSRPISSLIKVTLGEESNHPSFSTPCLALDETAAEKWVALTRRIANTEEKQRDSDKHLVRHLYDLHQLHSKELLTGQYQQIVQTIMQKDQIMFKNKDYVKDPIKTSQQALDLLFNDQKWKNHWELFLEQMVYETSKPSYFQALDALRVLSQKILANVNSTSELLL